MRWHTVIPLYQELRIIAIPVVTSLVFALVFYFYFFWDVAKTTEEDTTTNESITAPEDEEESEGDKVEDETVVQKRIEAKYVMHTLLTDGIQLEELNKLDEALECYLACLYDFKKQSKLVFHSDTDMLFNISECLKRISSIYVQKQNPVHALRFIMAEKFIYEQALVSLLSSSKGTKSSNSKKNAVVERIEALEKLSDLCYKQSEFELAADYATKAATIKSKVPLDEVSEDMRRTLQQLDTEAINQFTNAYLELGKRTYERNVHWYQAQRELEAEM